MRQPAKTSTIVVARPALLRTLPQTCVIPNYYKEGRRTLLNRHYYILVGTTTTSTAAAVLPFPSRLDPWAPGAPWKIVFSESYTPLPTSTSIIRGSSGKIQSVLNGSRVGKNPAPQDWTGLCIGNNPRGPQDRPSGEYSVPDTSI